MEMEPGASFRGTSNGVHLSTRPIDIGGGRSVEPRPFGRASRDFTTDELRAAVEYQAGGRKEYQVIPSLGQSLLTPSEFAVKTREEIIWELTQVKHVDEVDSRMLADDLLDGERYSLTEVWHDLDGRQIGFLSPPPTASPEETLYTLRVVRGRF